MAKKYKIATLGSHSALQILKGAKDEGFETIVVCPKSRVKLYKLFGVADKIIEVDDFSDFSKVENQLISENAIMIPHGSYISYIGHKRVEKSKVLYYGNKKILKWEADRNLERKWLKNSGLKLPRIYKSPKDIDKEVIVKFHGALGGKGFFFVSNGEVDFNRKITRHEKDKDYIIQEYIIGVPIYIHYFYSPITKKVEIMSCDRRYESNVDSIGRISARDQMALQEIDPSYVVVGNFTVTLRESLLPKALEMGERVVKESQKIAPPGLLGPFCLETCLTPDQNFYVFEISARIVAGTNLYINGSPLTQINYDEPMSTGRRIARDIKQAIETDQLDKILK